MFRSIYNNVKSTNFTNYAGECIHLIAYRRNYRNLSFDK